MVIKSIIKRMVIKNALVFFINWLSFYVISAIAHKRPDWSGFIIIALLIIWLINGITLTICLAQLAMVALIDTSVKVCIHEPHSSGIFAKRIRKYYGRDIEYFDSIRVCGIWICCDVWNEGGVGCIEDHK